MATHVSKAKKTKATSTKEAKAATEWNDRLRKKAIIFFAGMIAILVVFDLTPLGGSMHFYARWIECGERPITVSGGYFGGVSYYHPAPVVNIFRISERPYFCTALEAEQAGYSASEGRRYFPELEKLRPTQD